MTSLAFTKTPGFMFMILLVSFLVYNIGRSVYLEQKARIAARSPPPKM